MEAPSGGVVMPGNEDESCHVFRDDLYVPSWFLTMAINVCGCTLQVIQCMWLQQAITDS